MTNFCYLSRTQCYLWFGIQKQPSERFEEELESRMPHDDIIYFGDCEGEPVFYPLQHYNENGQEIEVFLD